MCRRLIRAALLWPLVLLLPAAGLSAESEHYLRDQYKGKTLLLRGFLAGDRLYYDLAGKPVGNDISGDWTSDGFVIIDDVSIRGQSLIFDAKRLLVMSADHQFQLRPSEWPLPKEKRKEPVRVRIAVDLGPDTPSTDTVEAAASKVFLSEHDSLAELVPVYWKPCVKLGLIGKDANCRFSSEILGIPGVVPREGSAPQSPQETEEPLILGQVFRVGNGVSSPKSVYTPEPEFSEEARAEKFQGTVVLGLIVNTEGRPTKIRILSPLGSGLDAKAVHAVDSWKFEPAEKDGQPVAVEIAVEVSFRLY